MILLRVFLLDDPNRFRSKLSDVFLIYWMTDVFQFGPAAMRQRLVELLDPPTLAAIATGPHPVAASGLIHILPKEVMVGAAGWFADHFAELDEDVGLEALRNLPEVAPEIAERIAIEHVARIGDKFLEDVRDGVCVNALASGRSDEGLVIGQQLVDRYLPGSKFGLRSALLGLCLTRDLPGGPAALLQELVRARDRRKLKGCLNRLLDRLSGSLEFRFVVESEIFLVTPLPMIDLKPLLAHHVDLKSLAQILSDEKTPPVARLIAWGREHFGADDRSTPMRLLEEGRKLDGLELELAILAATMFLNRLAVKTPPLDDLSLDDVIRLVRQPIDLGDLAPQMAGRLRAFPTNKVLRDLRKFLGPGDLVDPMARFNALAILRELAVPEFFEVLVDQLGREPDDPAVDHGVSGLAALGEPAAERLVRCFGDVQPRVQIQICRVVTRTGGSAACSLVQNWLPCATGQLRGELCDIVEFWPDASDVGLLEASEPGTDSAADYALVMMDLIHGIESGRVAERREELLKEDDADLPAACPCCGGKVVLDNDAHGDHGGDDDEYAEDDEGSGDHEQPVPAPAQPVRVEVQIGRNDPCPCGSGKKFKKCCLAKSDG